MTRPRARFLHRDPLTRVYVFALQTSRTSWAFVRVPVSEFWRAR